MTWVKIFVPGEYEDAYPYMGQLVALRLDGSVIHLHLDELVAEVTRVTGSPATSLLFSHNEYLEQEGTRLLLSDPSVAATLKDKLGGKVWEIVPRWSPADIRGAPLNGALLDMQIYNRRLYAATTAGIFNVDFNSEGSAIDFAHLTKRTDARCHSASVRYGTLVASCGSEGLLTSHDEFGALGPDKDRDLVVSRERSMRSSWIGYSLVNYPTSSHGEFLRARYEKLDRTAVVTDFYEDEDSLVPAQEQLGDAEFVFNNHGTFFGQYSDGTFDLATFTRSQGRLRRLSMDSRGELPRVLSAYPLADGIVVETFNAVLAVDHTGVELLHEDTAIKVRTFPKSKRYTRLTCVVVDQGFYLIARLPHLDGS